MSLLPGPPHRIDGAVMAIGLTYEVRSPVEKNGQKRCQEPFPLHAPRRVTARGDLRPAFAPAQGMSVPRRQPRIYGSAQLGAAVSPTTFRGR